MQFLVVALGVFLPLGLSLQLILKILQFVLHLLLGALGHLALLPLVLQLSLEVSDLLGEVATQLLCLLFLGRQVPLKVGLGSLQVDLKVDSMDRGIYIQYKASVHITKHVCVVQ